LPPFSGSKNKPSKKPAFATCFYAGFLLVLLFNPEDGGEMFFRNVVLLSKNYMALYPRR
jgi:hypothetical protein